MRASCLVLGMEAEDKLGPAVHKSRGANVIRVKLNSDFRLWERKATSQEQDSPSRGERCRPSTRGAEKPGRGSWDQCHPSHSDGKTHSGSNLNSSCFKRIPFPPVLSGQ
jgi:hypothetical protein